MLWDMLKSSNSTEDLHSSSFFSGIGFYCFHCTCNCTMYVSFLFMLCYIAIKELLTVSTCNAYGCIQLKKKKKELVFLRKF